MAATANCVYLALQVYWYDGSMSTSWVATLLSVSAALSMLQVVMNYCIVIEGVCKRVSGVFVSMCGLGLSGFGVCGIEGCKHEWGVAGGWGG